MILPMAETPESQSRAGDAPRHTPRRYAEAFASAAFAAIAASSALAIVAGAVAGIVGLARMIADPWLSFALGAFALGVLGGWLLYRPVGRQP